MKHINIEDIVQIAKEAGRLILKIYNSDNFDITIKSDESPVTAADFASHNLIIAALAKLSDYPIISEEDTSAYSDRMKFDSFWLVDPLDGTKDFIARNDEFTVNIALIRNNKPVLGVVHIPAFNTTYYAQDGQGAYLIKDDVTTRIFCRQPGSELICLESRFHSNHKTFEFCKKNNINQIIKFGSSIKLCKISEGVADVYPRFEPTKEWDTAAAHCILSEAGGKLIDLATNEELKYNKSTLVNNFFIASSKKCTFNHEL